VTADSGEVRVTVVGVFEEELGPAASRQRLPILVLRDDVNRELRLPIGSCEGVAIHVAVEQALVPRPLTHDLALRVLERLSAKLDRVVIADLSDDISSATLYLASDQGALHLDARPGDAVALAMRAEVPIYVTEDVLARAGEQGTGTP
jgi:bifunctional DNase/RNase